MLLLSLEADTKIDAFYSALHSINGVASGQDTQPV